MSVAEPVPRLDVAAGDAWLRSPRWPGAAMLLGAIAVPVAATEAVVVGTVLPEGGFWVVPMIALFAAGLLVARRRPEALAARRLLGLGTVAVVWIAGGLGLAIAVRGLGGGPWFVIADTVQVGLDLALPAAVLALLALYPDGRPQRAYEQCLARAALALVVVVPIGLLLARPTLQPALALSWVEGYAGPAPAVHSPVHLAALNALDAPLAFYARSALGILPIVAVGVLALRYRRFGPEERLQIRWPLAAAALVALQPAGNALVAAGVLPQLLADLPVLVMITVLAIALAIGLLDARLFDLGHLVRRSLAYVALWVAIGAVYVGTVAAAGVAASSEGLQVAIAVTIAVTLLAQPAWRAVARRAASWAYGERPSAPELLRRLGTSLEHTLEPEELARTLAATIHEGLGVAWVRLDVTGLSPICAGTPGGAPHATAPLVSGAGSVGTIECGPGTRRRAGPGDAELLATLARQAALAMSNARLASELRGRLAELAASRARIVEAEEEARRRIERDIHDGIQQELVALIGGIGLARSRLERDPGQLDAMLAEMQSRTRQALADLRELASGIHPSVLGDHGLVEAIETRAARLPLDVTVECPRELRAARFPEPVEGAAYFVVCEAFANALKHAGAEHIVVRLGRCGVTLEVEVADDGCGFEPRPAARGGLSGLADRTEALGGHLAVRSAPGAGTRIRAGFPIAEVVRA